MTRKNVSSLAIVVLFGLLLQVGMIFLDCTNSPADTAVRYAEAYYNLSPSMAKWTCGGASCGAHTGTCPKSVAADHIYDATAEMSDRGFGEGYARFTLSHIETRTEYLDDGTTADVHLTARTRRSVNPLYVWVGRLFGLGETREVENTIRVKLEDGSWKVCKSSAQL